MGDQLGVMLEENIPSFLRTLGQAVAASGKDFEGWLSENPEGVRELAAGYLC